MKKQILQLSTKGLSFSNFEEYLRLEKDKRRPEFSSWINIMLGIFFSLISVYSYGESSGPFFWEVSKENEEEGSPFYVLGTLHAGVALEDLQCSSEISSRLEKAPVLLTEQPTLSLLEWFKIAIQGERRQRFSSSTIGFNNLSTKNPPVF